MIGTGDAWHTVGLRMAGPAQRGHGCACAVVAGRMSGRGARDEASFAWKGGRHDGGWLPVRGDFFNPEGWGL